MNPQILEDTFHRVDFDRELVFYFFVAFSLFEKALKENGFYQVKGNEDIQPDWRRLASTIDEQFTATQNLPENQELKTVVDYFINNPPKKQVFRDSHIQFVNTGRSSDSDTAWLAILINRVRNNLFHGGKFSYERPRDRELLQFSLIILEEWANLNPDVKRTLQDVR